MVTKAQERLVDKAIVAVFEANRAIDAATKGGGVEVSLKIMPREFGNAPQIAAVFYERLGSEPHGVSGLHKMGK